jgi:hypothetical protein
MRVSTRTSDDARAHTNAHESHTNESGTSILLAHSLPCDNFISCVCSYAAALCVDDRTFSVSRCSTFSVQAGTNVAFNGALTSVYTGNVGVAPGTAITGNYKLYTGVVQANTSPAIDCAADELIAYNAAKSAVCPPGAANTLTNPDLGGHTFPPGVYCAAGGFLEINAGILTLDGLGDPEATWIFQTASTLITGTGTSFILQNGAEARNVVWQIGSSATIAHTSVFHGVILAYQSVSFDHDATIVGRAFAQAAVTFAGGNAVSLPNA